MQERTGSVLGTWKGKLTAKEQRVLMGQVIGKGTIVINGKEETVSNLVSVCFGQDYDYRNITRWVDMGYPTESDLMAAMGPCGK